MAVVVSYTPARQIKGRDWMMSVVLIDDSIAVNSSELREPKSIHMNIFGKSKENFPHLRFAGDVIRMHRVQLKTFEGQVQLTGLKKSSYVVCRCKQIEDGDNVTDDPHWIFVSSQNTMTSRAEELEMQNLWLWGQDQQVRLSFGGYLN